MYSTLLHSTTVPLSGLIAEETGKQEPIKSRKSIDTVVRAIQEAVGIRGLSVSDAMVTSFQKIEQRLDVW